MVPRAFMQDRPSRRQFDTLDERKECSGKSRSKVVGEHKTFLSSSVESTITTPAPPSPRSDPVTIPGRLSSNSITAPRTSATASSQRDESHTTTRSVAKRRQSAQYILSSTAIPVKRKAKGRPQQRLPNCDHVADFSKLLLDDVNKPRDRSSLPRSLSNPSFDALFGHIDGLVEGQMIIGSEGLDAGILSTRSMSSESMVSLASPDDFSMNDFSSPPPSLGRSSSERRLVANSESAASDHPLQELEANDDGLETPLSELAISPPSSPSPRPRPQPLQKRPSVLKSSLTASLKAIKSAAQSISNISNASPFGNPEDFGGRLLFDINPALTDDKRPPPSDEPPSPALRRYLNPYTAADSPAQLHFWLDGRDEIKPKTPDVSKSKFKIKKKYQKGGASSHPRLPAVVPLATCIPSTIRTAHASSPPIWLAPDGTPSNKHTAQPLFDVLANTTGQPRRREPRENRDFLRIFVAESNMRKSDKLDEKAESKACLWLPPVKEREDMAGTSQRRRGRERWQSWTVDDIA